MPTYLDVRTVKTWLDRIYPGCLEKEVQVFWENMLHVVYPSIEDFSVATKYRGSETEPDSQVYKHVFYGGGNNLYDVLIVELKRPKENLKTADLDRVATEQLDDHMAASINHEGTTLFGAVGMGKYVRFYKRVLKHGQIVPLHQGKLHLEHDAQDINDWFDYFKTHVAIVEEEVPLEPAVSGWSDWEWSQQWKCNSRYRIHPDGSYEWDYQRT